MVTFFLNCPLDLSWLTLKDILWASDQQQRQGPLEVGGKADTLNLAWALQRGKAILAQTHLSRHYSQVHFHQVASIKGTCGNRLVLGTSMPFTPSTQDSVSCVFSDLVSNSVSKYYMGEFPARQIIRFPLHTVLSR